MVELPQLMQIYDKYKDQGFEFLAVTMKRTTKEMIREIATDKGLNYHFLQDETGPDNTFTPDLFKMGHLGYVAIIDKEGRVRHYFDNWDETVDTVERYDRLVGKLIHE